jgi:hypothetical protein
MRIKADRTVGYVLLGVGLGLIIFAVCSMFNVFTGSAAPPAILEMKSIAIPLPTGGGMSPIEVEVASGAEISQIVNMVLWGILMLFVVTAGGTIGGLGVKLMRDIKVEVKRED